MKHISDYITEGNNSAFREYISSLDMDDTQKLLEVVVNAIESNVNSKEQENMIKYMKNAID